MDFLISISKLCLMAGIYSLLYKPITNLLLQNDKFKFYTQNRKNYIVKNLIKTGSMFIIFLNFIYIIYPANFQAFLTNKIIRNYGALYVGNDLGGLIMVKKLPKSTKTHHIITLFLYGIVAYFDVEKNDIVRMITIYTVFSFIPYSVNGFLAMRFFINKDTKDKKQLLLNKIIDINRICARYTYMITCMCNWLIHLLYFANKFIIWDFNVLHILYMLFLIPIINDDLVLLSWLNKKIC